MNTRHTLALLGALTFSASALCQDFDWSPEDAGRISDAIQSDTYGTVTSVLIRHHGEIVFEGYFNDADASTLHDTRSVTKTITGLGIGAAIADGYISIDTPLAPLFDDISPFQSPDPRKQAITLEDLLTMSGPLECDDWNQMSRGNEERMYIVEDWNAFFWNLPIRGFPSWATPPDQAEFGRSFAYCTAGVQIAAEAVSRAAGLPFADYVEAELFAPMGIDAFEWPLNGLGNPHLGGGLRLTTRDLSAFAELQLNLGEHEGQRILPAAWMQASVTPRAVIEQAEEGWRYGYLWWLIPYQVDGQAYYAHAMNGNGGNRVVVLPEFELTFVFTNTDYNTRTMHQNSAAFFEAEIISRLATDR